MVGKLMDVIRITGGMPLIVYYEINDEDVIPREHFFNALDRPIIYLVCYQIVAK